MLFASSFLSVVSGSSALQVFLSLGTMAFTTVLPPTVKSDAGDGGGVDAVGPVVAAVVDGS